MSDEPKKLIYIKHSKQGVGSIPIGTQGDVLLYVKHPVTTKLLVDFHSYGKAIIPLSSAKVVEEEDV